MPSRVDNLESVIASLPRMMMPRAWFVAGSGVMR